MASKMTEDLTMEDGFECLSHALSERDRLTEEELRERIKEDIKELDELERSVLRRTVLVTEVKGMKNPAKRKELERFFRQRFGPVEFCEATNLDEAATNQMHATMNPPIRVRFRNPKDAEKIFRKGSLLGMIAHQNLKSFKHRLGLCEDKDGSLFFKVRPSYRYPGMLDGELTRKVVTMRATKMSLGHWLTPRRDAYLSVYADSEVDHSNLWLEEYATNVKPQVTVDIRNLRVELKVPRNHDDDGNFRFNNISDFASFSFKSIIQSMELCRIEETGEYAIAMSLKHPPRLETQKNPISGVGYIFYTDDRERTTRFDNVPVDHFGKSTAVLLYFSADDLDERLFGSPALQSVKNCGLVREELVSLTQAISTGILPASQEEKRNVAQSLAWIHEQFPKIGFLLKSLLDNGRTTYHHLYSEEIDGMNLLGYILNHEMQHKPLFEASIYNCLEAMARSFTRYPFHLFLRIMRSKEEPGFRLEDALGRPPGASTDVSVPIPRVLISPSRVSVQKFETEMGNSCIRKFCQEEGFPDEAFLRVHVGDEDGQRLFYRDLVPELEDKLRREVLTGIAINETKYECLAYSSSQLKEGAFWMVCVPEGWTVLKIVKKLGDFSDCKSVQKFASSIGLRFSTTYQSLPSHAQSPARGLVYAEIGDITSEYNKRKMVHSDGNGMIRRIAANEVLRCIPSSPANLQDVSILQIRAGGAKGTVLIVDDPETYISGGKDSKADVFIRESMIKFKVDKYSYLEICSIGKYAPYYLNRNVILLLAQQGIADKVFLKMQSDFLNDLDKMLVHSQKAKQMLPRLVGKDARILRTLEKMISMGQVPSRDPFLFGCLHAVRTHCHFGLRKKSRIFVSKGAVLMGAIDVTGLLPEGCIFAQVRQKGPESVFKPLEGPCMVTKHPVMHPGDVQMLLATDIPELRGFRNVILFSQHGKRPQADTMSGSDLDGDEFALTWDGRLFLGEWNSCKREGARRWTTKQNVGRRTILDGKNMETDAKILLCVNKDPLDYHVHPKKAVSDTKFVIENENLTEKLVDNFFEYIRNDKLGWIGMLWQDYAAKFGANCDQCIELAKQHSFAVDYPKTGAPARVPGHIVLSKHHPRAHWREKKGSPSFDDSKSILGKLYNNLIDRSKQNVLAKCKNAIAGRQIDFSGVVLSIVDDMVPNVEDSLRAVFDVSLVQCFDPEAPASLRLKILAFARTERRSFERKIVAIMNEHGIRSEGETFTGCIHRYHSMNQRRQFETSQDVLRRSGDICDEYRDKFFRKVLEFHVEFSNTTVPNTGAPSVEAGQDLEHVESTVLAENSLDEDWYSMSQIGKLMAAAYYIVTYDPSARWNGDPDKGQVLFGFPWIVADVLQKNRNSKLGQQKG